VRTELDPRHQPDQPDQAELRHQARGWIASPRCVPPSLGDEGPQSPFDPAIKPVEEFSDVGLAVVVSPAAYDRVENLDHLSQRYRCASAREVADLILEPRYRLLTRHGVQVERIGRSSPLVRGQPQTLATLDLVAKELKPVVHVNDAGLLRM